jgi:predicted restriction endonuclease
LDVHNGLLLSALWDAAFDKGLVSFGGEGNVLVSPKLSEAARAALGVDRVPQLRGLRDSHQKNLAAHRTCHDFE